MRVERLYPLPWRTLPAMVESYPATASLRWVQEEPANQGAWPTFGLELPELLPEKLTGIKALPALPQRRE